MVAILLVVVKSMTVFILNSRSRNTWKPCGIIYKNVVSILENQHVNIRCVACIIIVSKCSYCIQHEIVLSQESDSTKTSAILAIVLCQNHLTKTCFVYLGWYWQLISALVVLDLSSVTHNWSRSKYWVLLSNQSHQNEISTC